MMPAFKKVFDLVGDDIAERSTKNKFLKNKIVFCDEKCLGESQARPLTQNDDKKRANIILSRLEKQMRNQKN